MSQNQTALIEINKQIWLPFTQAFETKDLDLFKSIHSSNLIRVNADGKKISDFDTYMSRYQDNWERSNRIQTISFRFLERLNDGTSGSERGIYKLTLHPNTSEEVSYYGKFHVILTKGGSSWKILVDYDSTEGKTIGERDFNSGFEMTDLNKF